MENGITPLHLACGLGAMPSLEAAKQAIASNPDSISVSTWAELYTPLHIAASSGSLEIVDLLLRHGADYQSEDFRGTRPVAVAAEAGHERIVNCILDAMESSGCSMEDIAKLQGTNTIVHLAASIGHVDMLKSLIRRLGMIQLEARNESGVTPLMAACGGESIDVYNDERIWDNQRAETVLFLLGEGADPLVKDNKGRTVLHTLATFARGAGSMIETLLQKGIEIDSKTKTIDFEDCSFQEPGATALHVASKNMNDDMVQILLSHKADPRIRDAHQRIPLHVASHSENDEFLGPLEFAENRTYATVKLLLDSAPDMIDAKDENGYTPLLLASKTLKTMFSVLRLLHESGADITAVDDGGENAIHLAGISLPIYSPRSDMYDNIQYLVQNGVDIEGRDSSGATPLIRAVSRTTESSDAVGALLQNGAEVNATFQNGTTALHCAYGRGYTDEIGKLLLEHGADLHAKNEQGQTPSDLIPKRGPVWRRGGGFMGPAQETS